MRNVEKTRALAYRIATDPVRLSIALGLLVAGLALFKYGISMSPNWENLFQVAQQWRQPKSLSALQPPQDFILSNSVLPAALGIMGLTDPTVYVSIQVLLAMFAIMIPFLMPSTLRNRDQSKLLFLMLVGGPIAAVLITWVGGYDALAVIGICIAVLARTRTMSAFGWFLFGLAHGSLAVVALVLVVVFHAFSSPRHRVQEMTRNLVIPASAVVLGWMGAWLLTLAWGGATSRLDVYLLYPFSHYLNSFISGMPFYLFSVLGAGWIVALSPGVRRLRSTKSLLGLALAAGLLLPLVALDQTRIASIALLPVVLTWVRVASVQLGSPGVGRLWRHYAVATAVIPVLIVWEGSISMTGWEQVLSWRASFM